VAEDIGVACFDDIPLSSSVSPGLTTARIRSYEICEEATLMLLGRLKGKRKGEKNEIIEAKLIEGESCRQPKVSVERSVSTD